MTSKNVYKDTSKNSELKGGQKTSQYSGNNSTRQDLGNNLAAIFLLPLVDRFASYLITFTIYLKFMNILINKFFRQF